MAGSPLLLDLDHARLWPLQLLLRFDQGRQSVLSGWRVSSIWHELPEKVIVFEFRRQSVHELEFVFIGFLQEEVLVQRLLLVFLQKQHLFELLLLFVLLLDVLQPLLCLLNPLYFVIGFFWFKNLWTFLLVSLLAMSLLFPQLFNESHRSFSFGLIWMKNESSSF